MIKFLLELKQAGEDMQFREKPCNFKAGRVAHIYNPNEKVNQEGREFKSSQIHSENLFQKQNKSKDVLVNCSRGIHTAPC